MAKFLNPDLADLTHQLTLSPRRLRMEQVVGIDRLLGLIHPDKAYPYDFVCYHITGYRNRKAVASDQIVGKALISDLVTMAEVISRKANLTVEELNQLYATHEQVASELNVSTKTIRRWRNRGLMGLRAVFEDGVNRLAFLRTTVDRFVAAHQQLVAKGSAFRQLSSQERMRIVERAREILSQRPRKLHVVARMISEETGRAIETVRYTLRRYDRVGKGEPLFANDGQAALSDRHRALLKLREAGESMQSIADAYDCHVDDIEATLREIRVHQWKESPLEYVHNELFDAPSADELILGAPEPPPSDARLTTAPRDLPAYLQALYRVPLLTPDQEKDLFRRYNYLKYRTAKHIEKLSPTEATQEQVESILSAMDCIDAYKQRIIQANLRLVVSITKKHVGWSQSFFDVISDGNMSLMRAIEKFDYGLGNRFSTYATWAIVKNFARTIPESHYHYNRYVTGQDELLAAAPDHQDDAGFSSDQQEVRSAIAKGLDQLDDRERDIVAAHFGLGGHREPMTLDQLGKRFGVTKERIRQIERRALQRLREVLSPSIVDVLE